MTPVKLLTRQERTEWARMTAEDPEGMWSDESMLRALATIDAIEADLRWLSKRFMTIMDGRWHQGFISENERAKHVAPWVEPS